MIGSSDLTTLVWCMHVQQGMLWDLSSYSDTSNSYNRLCSNYNRNNDLVIKQYLGNDEPKNQAPLKNARRGEG